jgi:predicted metal-dependent phosphoesterase TrpH
MDGTADLHMHTLWSDGALSPTEVVRLAHRAGLSTIAITDHDHTGAIEEARLVGSPLGIDVVSGVELSVVFYGREVHVLGLFFDHTHGPLLEYMVFLRAARRTRAERIVGRLNALQIPLTLEAVLEQADGGAVGRPHVAAAMVAGGFAGSIQEAFGRFLRDGGPAWEQKVDVSPRDAAERIAEAGGVTFVAHPGEWFDTETVSALLDQGIDGVEAVHPSHSQERTAVLRALAAARHIPVCGGSDFHGGKRNDGSIVGRYTVSAEELETIRRHRHTS